MHYHPVLTAEHERVVRTQVLVIGLVVINGCSFVEFESPPYRPSEVFVVYSAQEDLTFLSWRISESADPASVSFSIRDGASYRPLELDAAPFPADPYRCGRAWCFQYQLAGRLSPDATVPLLRAEHPRFGVFASAPFTVVDAERTFDVDPIAIDRNASIDPRRFDWFAEEGVPLVRGYGWRATDGDCSTDGGGAFAALTAEVAAPSGFPGAPKCFEATPDRRDADGVRVRVPLVASAETYLLPEQRYLPPTLVHQTLYGVLLDLAVADPARCESVSTWFEETLSAEITRRDAGARSIGVYEPAPGWACRAHPPDAYPVEDMLRDAYEASVSSSEALRTVVWIYVSNRQEPSDVLNEAWTTLLTESRAVEPFPVYSWAIVSPGRVAGGDSPPPIGRPGDRPPEGFDAGEAPGGREDAGDGPRRDLDAGAPDPLFDDAGAEPVIDVPFSAEQVLPYRPPEDETMAEDIATVAQQMVPFLTMDHDASVALPVRLSAGVPRPSAARLCRQVPRIAGLTAAGIDLAPSRFEWPDAAEPVYTVDLGAQRGVPSALFAQRSSDVRFEVCVRYCDGPVRTEAGVDLPSWADASSCAGVP